MGKNRYNQLEDRALLKRLSTPRLNDAQVTGLVAQFLSFTHGQVPTRRALEVALAHKTELVRNGVVSPGHMAVLESEEPSDDEIVDALDLHKTGNAIIGFLAFYEAYKRYGASDLERMGKGMDADHHAAQLAYAGYHNLDVPGIAKTQTILNELRLADRALPISALNVDGVLGPKTKTALACACEVYGCEERDLGRAWRMRIDALEERVSGVEFIVGRYSTLAQLVSVLQECVHDKSDVLEDVIHQYKQGTNGPLKEIVADPVMMQKYLPEVNFEEFRAHLEPGVRSARLKDEQYPGYVPVSHFQRLP